MKTCKYILFCLLLAATPTIESQAQFGIFKALGRAGKSAGKTAAKGAAKGAKNAAKATGKRATKSAAQKSAMVQRVSRSKIGQLTTERARLLARSSIVGGKSLDRAAIRVTEKLAAKGGTKALQDVTTAELRNLVAKEVAHEEMKFLGKCAIVGVPYSAWKHIQKDEDKVVLQTESASDSTMRSTSSMTMPTLRLSESALQSAKKAFGGNEAKIEILNSDVANNQRLAMMLERNPELLAAYYRCGDTNIRTDISWLNYMAKRTQYNDNYIGGLLGSSLMVMPANNDKNSFFLTSSATSATLARIYMNYNISSNPSYSYDVKVKDNALLNIAPLPNSYYSIEGKQIKYYTDESRKLHVIKNNSEGNGVIAINTNPGYQIDDQGRVVLFSYIFVNADMNGTSNTPCLQKLTDFALMRNTRGEISNTQPAKGFVGHYLYPIWLGGEEVWLNIVPVEKAKGKMWNKSEKELAKLLKDKNIDYVQYTVLMKYSDSFTLTPSDVKIIKKWNHIRKGEQESSLSL